jgi:hypothetical protein
MTHPRKLVPEPGVQELLSDEIGRLVMRADRVERHEVEALVMRVKAPRSECTLRAPQRRKVETVT